MTDVIMIPLTKLVESADNVRRSNRKGGVGELAASVKAHGLLQSIVVKETSKGKFAVIAGGRRLRALRLLAKAGDIAKNALIPCRVISGDDNATELSLAENVQRQDLAIHEELAAFQALVDAGEGPETIAARFGVSPQHVARRLKLARVSPRLIEALKREEVTIDQLAALAVVDDHAAQEKAYYDAPGWARTPERLRAQVTQAHVPETDKLARFVGLDEYQSAGGGVVSDLFAETEDNTRYLADRDLLTRLAASKLAPLAEYARAEGWAWVEIAIDGVAWTQFPDRIHEHRRDFSEDERAEHDRLLAKLDATEDDAEIEKIEAAIDGIAVPEWDAGEVALAGAIITLSHAGEPKVERGLVKANDVRALKSLRRKRTKTHASYPADDKDAEDDAAPAAAPRPRLPAKLVDELMAHKTLALRTEVATKPDLALRLLVLALASNALQETVSLVRVRIDEVDVSRQITRAESPAPQALAQLGKTWRERLPSGSDALWAFIAEAGQQTLLDLLAVLVAPAIELRPSRAEGLVDAICNAAGLDMSKYWSATPQSYFEHVRRDVIIDAIKEVNPTLDRSKLDKASKNEALHRAKAVFKGSNWLPEPLRAKASSAPPAQAIAAE